MLGTHSFLHEDNFLKTSKLPLDKKLLFASLHSRVEPCRAVATVCEAVAEQSSLGQGRFMGEGEEWEETKVSGKVKQGKQYLCVFVSETETGRWREYFIWILVSFLGKILLQNDIGENLENQNHLVL